MTQPPPLDPPTPPAGGPYPGGPYPGQPYPGQPYPGQPYPGQPYPGQPYPGQPYPGQPYPGQPYPGQPYPGQPYPGQLASVASPSTPARPGGPSARLRRRPEARFGPSLAAVGAALLATGLAIWSVGYLIAGLHGGVFGDGTGGPGLDDGRRWLGALLFWVLTVAGYAVLVLRRRGPLATAGVVAVVIALPIALVFSTLDIGGAVAHGADLINVDVLFLVPIIVFLASYLLVPGARGRAVLLALAAGDIYTYAAIKTLGSSAVRLGTSVADGASPSLNSSGTGSVAALGLSFGLVYYAGAAWLDRSGRPGAAVGLIYPAFGATVAGLIGGVVSFGQVGEGVALILVGAVLALYGGWAARRFTTWAWSAAIALGVLVLVSKIGTSHYTEIGILLGVLGLVVVAAGLAASRALREPPDLAESLDDQRATVGTR